MDSFMVKPVHIQGMGVTGSYLARELEHRNVPFTWEDSDSPISAWPASTGSVYPSGEPNEQWCYQRWAEHCRANAPHVERASYWYSSLKPPHGIKGEPRKNLGFLRLHELPSYHVNVQRYVQETRERHREQRREAEPGSVLVISHGFSSRLHHYVWGWSCKVKLEFDVETFGERPNFYCREGRFVWAYAYPVPGEDAWYAGSSLIVQHKPKLLDAQAKLMRWLQLFYRMTHGYVQVKQVEEARQGWRPQPANDDHALVRKVNEGQYVRGFKGVILCRPQGASGVRLAPEMAEAVLRSL